MKLGTILFLAIILTVLPVTAHAQGGRPILTVRNYAVIPATVKAGQEFTVEIEIYNNGSRAGENTMAVFTGGDFLPVGQAGHVLWQLHINHTVKVRQQMRAPSTLSSGVHALRVDLSANDYAGNHYDYPQTIPIEVTAASTGVVSAPPKVVIESAQTEPALLAPGMAFTLTLRLANQGDRTATDLYLGCADDGLAVPVDGANLSAVGSIAAGREMTVTMPLMLSWDVTRGGRQRLAIDLDYYDAAGATYRDAQTIGIEVDAALAPSPQIILESYTSDPVSPMPGDSLTLTVRVRNIGTEAARRLSLAFGGQDGAGLAPFMTLDAGHVAFVGDLPPGEEVGMVRHLLLDGTAQPKAYSLPLILSYSDGRAQSSSMAQSLSLIVQPRPVRDPQLIIAGYHTAPHFVAPGDPFTLTVEIANVGAGDARELVVALGGQDGAALEPFMTVGSGNVRFVGAMDQGDRVEVVQPMVAGGTAKAQAYNLPVALSYTGPDGAVATQVQRISLIVRRRVELQVDVYSRPESMAVNTPAQLSLEVRNLGRDAVDVVGVRATGLNASLQTGGTPFVGPLDPGGSAPLDLLVTPTRGGTTQLNVHVEYRDDLNRLQMWTQALTFEVEEREPLAAQPGAPDPAEETSSLASWQAVLRGLKGFVGFGS
jgi:hypothetical protein